VHTIKRPETILKHLSYDSSYRLWRADMQLAIQDMKRSRRNCDLIDWETINELI
jgi:hypothetical protein